MIPRPPSTAFHILPWLLFSLSCICPPRTLAQYTSSNTFYFFWPSNAAQCDVVNLQWSGGVAPFRAWIIPIYSQPMIYDIPASATSGTTSSYPISLQLDLGVKYVVFMSDANGLGSGGSSEVMNTLSSNSTDCLNTASQNSSSLDFTYTLSGQAKQCERGFEMSWTGGKEAGPYNFTVVPLDQGFRPYDIALDTKNSYQSDWQLNMTAGSRFTIMMNSKNGYGRGGVGGIYQVDNSSETDCIDQSHQPTGSWPVGLATNTLPAATLPITSPADSNKRLSGGAIAGVVIGVLALLALVAGLVWFLLRRKRRRQSENEKLVSPMDLGDDELAGSARLGHTAPHPYLDTTPPAGDADGRPSMGGGGSGTSSTAAELVGLGGGGEVSSPVGSHPDYDDRPSGPGIAGPLPSKTTRPFSAQPSSRPTQSVYTMMDSHPTGETKSSPVSSGPPPIGQPGGGAGAGQMRIANPENPEALPALLPPGAAPAGPGAGAGGGRRHRDGGPAARFRRHEDAGRIPHEEVVDLPPLYTDVPRDGPRPPLAAGAAHEEDPSPAQDSPR